MNPKGFEHFTFRSIDNNTIYDETRKYKSFGLLNFGLDFPNWTHYKRAGKSILDTLSTICSIGNAIFSGFQAGFFILYSNNLDNYKLIQNILFSKDNKLKAKKNW